MWNKIAGLMQDINCIRLGVALLASALLHTLLLAGFHLTQLNIKKETHFIEARIQMLKPVVKPVEPLKPEAVTTSPPKYVKETKPEANQEEDSGSLPESNVETPFTERLPAELLPEQFEDSVSEPLQGFPELEDAGVVINENAYQYLETDFDVRTKIDGSADGTAKITYNLIDESHYELKWLTEGRGFAALLFPDLLQLSEGFLIKTGLQPVSYLYKFGDRVEKKRTAKFDWLNKKVTLESSKGVKTEDLPDETQDLLSFMYQFMYVAPLQIMQIPIATGKQLRTYDYSFEGEELLNFAFGELKTMHIVHSGTDSDERTELWLAIDYQYVPVKIRKIEKNGNLIEMVATRINLNRPIQPK